MLLVMARILAVGLDDFWWRPPRDESPGSGRFYVHHGGTDHVRRERLVTLQQMDVLYARYIAGVYRRVHQCVSVRAYFDSVLFEVDQQSEIDAVRGLSNRIGYRDLRSLFLKKHVRSARV